MLKTKNTVLEIDNVVKEFPIGKNGKLTACNKVSLCFEKGKTLGIIGESGCGKSTLMKIIMQLEEPTSGQVLYHGEDITKLKGEKLRQHRRNVQMVFQDPFASLNPYHTIFHHILRPLMINHMANSQEEYEQKVIELLERVELTPAVNFMYRRPHELSGGQRQRVMIAMAFINNPALLIADEPTTALDVIHRNGIIDLFSQMKANGVGILMVTHDFATALQLGGNILVMKEGKIIESGEVQSVFDHTTEPYTRSLIEAYSLSCAFTKGAES